MRYRKDKYEELKAVIEEIDDNEAVICSSERLREIGEIYRKDISEFVKYLSEHNGKNFEELYNNEFSDIIEWIFSKWQS